MEVAANVQSTQLKKSGICEQIWSKIKKIINEVAGKIIGRK